MKIFLTGGTGFIGQRLVQALIQHGWEVIALVRNPESVDARAIQALGTELVRGDITDRELLRQAMTKTDALIHNAGWYELGIPESAQDEMRMINVQGTKNTLGLAVELGIARIVYVSSIVVYGDTGDVIADEKFQRTTPPKSYYEQTKKEAHEYAVQLQQGGAPVVIACPAPVIGPGDHSGVGYLVRMYVHGWLPPILFGANGRRAHVHVDDVAEGIARCVERGKVGESYILSSGNMQHRDFFNLWKQTPGGMKLTLFYMPDSLGMLFNTIADPIERLFGLPIVFCLEFAHAAFGNWRFSAAKAERELGMQFRSLEQAWLDTLKAERALAKK
jgi:dihydroflavonol-4-reductase